MTTPSTHLIPGPMPTFAIFRLLAEGAKDMWATRFYGVVFGITFVLMGYVISSLYHHLWQLTIGMTAAFFLMGPFICCGIYELSRQIENGDPVTLRAALTSWSRNWKSTAFFAAILTFFMIMWIRVSVVLFALFATHSYPELTDMVRHIINMKNIEFLAVCQR